MNPINSESLKQFNLRNEKSSAMASPSPATPTDPVKLSDNDTKPDESYTKLLAKRDRLQIEFQANEKAIKAATPEKNGGWKDAELGMLGIDDMPHLSAKDRMREIEEAVTGVEIRFRLCMLLAAVMGFGLGVLGAYCFSEVYGC